MPSYWKEASDFLTKKDPILGKIIQEYKGESLRSRQDLFYTLIRSIAGQQISVKAADSVWARLMEKAGEIRAEKLLALSSEELFSVGLSRRKVEYIQGISKEGERLAQIEWQNLDDAQVIKELTALRGVGEWTAQMVMIFALCRPDILPLADIGLLRAVEKQYAKGERLPVVEVERIAEAWRPWRSVATWYLWRDLDPVPVEY